MGVGLVRVLRDVWAEGGSSKGWEVGENYATMLNVPQSNKGYRVETKKKRGGAGNAKYEILEDSNSPPPQPTPSAFPMHRLSLLYLETVPTIFFFFFFFLDDQSSSPLSR